MSRSGARSTAPAGTRRSTATTSRSTWRTRSRRSCGNPPSAAPRGNVFLWPPRHPRTIHVAAAAGAATRPPNIRPTPQDVAAARRALRAAAVGVFKGAHAARRDAPLPEGGVVLLDRRGRVDQSARIPRAVDEIRGRRPFRSSGGAGELPRLQHGRLARERRRQRPGSDTTVARGVARGARAVPPARPGRARVVAVVAHERELDGRGRPPALRLRVHEEEGLRRQGRLLLVHPALARGDPAGPRVGRAEVLRVRRSAPESLFSSPRTLPRRGRGVGATRLRGISTSWPRRRRDPLA